MSIRPTLSVSNFLPSPHRACGLSGGCTPPPLPFQVSASTVSPDCQAVTQLSLLPLITPRACLAIVPPLPAIPGLREHGEEEGGVEGEGGRGEFEVLLASSEGRGLFMTKQGLPSERGGLQWASQPSSLLLVGGYVIALVGEGLQAMPSLSSPSSELSPSHSSSHLNPHLPPHSFTTSILSLRFSSLPPSAPLSSQNPNYRLLPTFPPPISHNPNYRLLSTLHISLISQSQQSPPSHPAPIPSPHSSNCRLLPPVQSSLISESQL